MEMTDIMADMGEITASEVDDVFTIKAIKAGTVAHTRDGIPITFCAKLLERMAPSWVGGFIKVNHEDIVAGEIISSEWEAPFITHQITGLSDEDAAHLRANEQTGFSIDAKGQPGELETYTGTGISILYEGHNPACSGEAGCGLINKPIMAEEITAAEIVADKLQIDTLEAKLTEATDMLAEKETALSGMYTEEQMTEKVAATIEASAALETEVTEVKAAVKGMFPKGIDATFEAEVMETIEAQDYKATVLKLGEIDFTPIEASIPTESETVEPEIVAEEKTSALDAALEKLNTKYIGA